MRTFVAHGSGSDPGHAGYAQRFGNQPNSEMTSLGLYRITDFYVGTKGPSYDLAGLNPTNSNAEERDIKLHPSVYVTPQHVDWSEGCAAVPVGVIPKLNKEFGTLTGGLLWIDAPGVQAPTCEAMRTPWPNTISGSWFAESNNERACHINS